MVKSNVLVVICFLFCAPAFCQVNRYMVFFTDKPNTYSIADPSPYLSAKAIQRRVKEHSIITVDDLPVNPAYVQQLRDAGADVFFRTKWMNGVLIQCDASLVSALRGLNFVTSVLYVAPNEKLTGGRQRSKLHDEATESTPAESSDVQLQMIGLDAMHANGYHGEGVTIAVLDAGFPGVNIRTAFKPLITEDRINLGASHDFIANSTNVFQYDAHGTEVLSVIAALRQDVFTGGAYKAKFQLYVTEDVNSEYKVEEYNWLFAAERADSAGADIISTSLGYNEFDDAKMDYKVNQLDGNTAVITRAAQLAADRGIAVICSAGNEGLTAWHSITPPSDAKDVMAVANVNSFEQQSLTSSSGPTADGRIKPDVAALGTAVAVITPSGTPGSLSGTSLAAPLITSLVAGLMQQFPTFTSKEIFNAIKRTASQATAPDNLIGYGVPNYSAVINYLNYVPQQNDFEVYPNPFTTTLTVHPQNPEVITQAIVEITTIQGQILQGYRVLFNWLSPQLFADLSSLSKGMYVVRITYNNKQSVHKIIKQ